MEEEQDEKSLDNRIIKWVSKNLIKSFGILILTIFTILLMVFVITALIYEDKTILDPNEIGDAIGGMTAPIIGLFSAFLVYLAFRAQKEANDELIDFNKKQSSNLELNEIMFLEEKTKQLLNEINLILYGENDKIIKYEGVDAIKIINDFLNNYITHNEDDFSNYIEDNKKIYLNNFNNFINNTNYFYLNLHCLLIFLQESNINIVIKEILYNNYKTNFLVKIHNIDFLVNNYKNIGNPEFGEKLKLLLKKINDINNKFNKIEAIFKK